MPRYNLPIMFQMTVSSTDPSHANGELQVWFNSLRAGDYDKFLQPLREGKIHISNMQVNQEDMQDVMMEHIEAKHTQKQLDEQRAKWKADEPNDNPNAEE